MVRRISALSATPSASANSMHATGTTPAMSYQVLLKRPPKAMSSGSRAHVVTVASAAVTIASTPKISTILVVIQRSGLIDCVQARRCVPASYSRDMSGAAQNIPASSGIATSAPVTGGIEWKSRCSASIAEPQLPCLARQSGNPSAEARRRAITPTARIAPASPARMIAATPAAARCCRQVCQIIVAHRLAHLRPRDKP